MKNLAGHPQATEICVEELRRCGINVCESEKPIGEPQSMVYGQLGKYKFTRAWYYWIVEGDVPLTVAYDLYNNYVGQTDIRVCGNCTCPKPDEYIVWKLNDGTPVLSTEEKENLEYYVKHTKMVGEVAKEMLKQNKFSDDPKSIGAKPYIESYHIDSGLGLYIFVQTHKSYELV